MRPPSVLPGRSLAALLVAALAVGCGSAANHQTAGLPPQVDVEVEERSIDQLQQAMTTGRATSRAITQRYLARIEAIDRTGPTLRSVIEINPDALAIAEALDRERRESGPRGPLHGIPVLIKDNIDTADRMMTTAGSLALEGPPPSRDAFIVERLRAAGAVLLGKTNLSEWANFRSLKSTSGWSARGGLVRNPYALDRNACGSSSGTGAAVAASLAAAGVGTETDGSIMCPSSVNGLVGIKPTVGLLSRSGIVPIAPSQDTPGPMARTVRDAVLLLGAMAGPDPRDPATGASAGRAQADYAAFLDPNSLKQVRIGVLRGTFFGYSDAADRLAEAAIARMKELGADIVDPVMLPNATQYGDSELEVLLYEFKASLNAYLASRSGLRVRTLADVIAFNNTHRDREMPFFGQDLLTAAETKGPLTDSAYRLALERNRRLSREEGIDLALKLHRVDVLAAPTVGPAWVTDLLNGDHFLGASAKPAATAGYPSITVPIGDASGLPVGISFFSTAWSEPLLIKLAYAFEQATQHRKAPRLLPTVGY